ncbi:hypothetical protein, conserved [Leishmania tarentolae]|uniref:Atg6 BARA domain-containing protein n=1 Tax=Leishmania tarentolae TaxID=5689 RepID=A0A640KA55_LEITA|nr:hypothetical protein, conserved [Leishmania tarentolae]
MRRSASDVPSSTPTACVYTAGAHASTSPSATRQPNVYEACPVAPRTCDGVSSVARGGGSVCWPASALRFTCCRCRRSLVVRPVMQSNAVLIPPPRHEVDSRTCGSAAAVEGAQRHVFCVASPAPTVEKAVRGSHATCGAGGTFCPLEPPVTALGKEERTARCKESGDAFDATQTTATSAAVSEGRGEPAGGTAVQSTDEALLDALPSHFFSSAELLTPSHLADVLARAHGSDATAAQTTMCAETTSKSNHPLTSSSPPQSFSHAALSDAAVLNVSQLESLGVPIRSATCRDKGEADDTDHRDHLRSGAMLRDPVDCTQETNSSSAARPESVQPHLTPPDEDNDTSTGEAQRIRSPRTHSTPTLLPPRSRAPLSSPALPSEPALKSRLGLSISASTPESDPATLVPFDERCRLWMRLVARTSAPYEQPLCVDCWRSACLVPLQQRTRLSLEGMKTLATIVSSTPAEKLRFSIMCYAEPAAAPLRGAFTSVGVRRGFEEDENGHALDSMATTESLDRPLPLMSLDAVAANVFGANEASLLHSLEALSAPHGRSVAAARGAFTVLRPLECASGAPLEQRRAAEAERCDDASASSSPGGEAEQIMAELASLRAQQECLEQQVGALRSVLHSLEPRKPSHSSGEARLGGPIAESPSAVTPQGWQELAAAHNLSEVQRAFTVGDEAAERQYAMADLAKSFAYVSTTPVDALCFPIDVSGPVGLIAGLRLGLVPPYSGSTNDRTNSSDGDVRRGGASVASEVSALRPLAHAGVSVSEERVRLNGFVQRQVGYAQLLLSGNTSADGDGHNSAVRTRRSEYSSSVTGNLSRGDAAPVAEATPAVTAAKVNTRVSPLEVNAACGYLLLLLNYLAHVNGFSFRTAVLRPAGSRSTVALLKRVPAAAKGAAGRGGAAAATTSSVFFPFIFSYFSEKGAAATQASGNVRSTRATTKSSFAYVVDQEVDFYLTDRLLAWRTFGTACVAVATCVKELADALHESLRCWRVRESMVSRPAPSAVPAGPFGKGQGMEAASGFMAVPAAAGVAGSLEHANGREGAQACAEVSAAGKQQYAPVSLPQLLQDLSRTNDHRNSAENAVRSSSSYMSAALDATQGSPGTTTAARSNEVRESASAFAPQQPPPEVPSEQRGSSPAVEGTFPLQPPFHACGDTVDGFSVRHGSVSDAIWTLGMKKLLSNVQWCMKATVELERLYAITGEAADDGADEQVDDDSEDSGKLGTLADMRRE